MKTQMPSYVISRQGDAALCVSIRDMDRGQVIDALQSLIEFFALGAPYEQIEVTSGNKLHVLHPAAEC